METIIEIQEQIARIAKEHPQALKAVLDEWDKEKEEFIASLPPNTKLPERFI